MPHPKTGVHRSRSYQRHPKQSANRTRTPDEKKWSYTYRDLWWVRWPHGQGAEPPLPLPADKLPEAELADGKLRALRAVQHFGVWVEASRASGMGRFQLGMLLRKVGTPDPEFRAQMHKARTECREGIERAFIERAKQSRGDLAGIFYLKHNTTRYREISRVQLTGADGGPVQYLDTRTELLRRIAKMTGSDRTGSDDVPIEVNGVEVRQLAAGSESAGSRGPGAGSPAAGSRGPDAGSDAAGSGGSRGPGSDAGSGVSGSARARGPGAGSSGSGRAGSRSARGPALVPEEEPRVRKVKDTDASPRWPGRSARS